MEAETKTCCVTGHRDIPAEKKGIGGRGIAEGGGSGD